MKPRLNTPKKVVWHHSNGVLFFPCAATQHHNVEIVDDAHVSRWPGFTSQIYKNADGELFHVGYHLVIDLINETITQTRAFDEEGAHCIGMNRSSIGVLIIGNYDSCSGEKIPKDKKWLIFKAWEMIHGYAPHLTLKDNVPHRTYATKSCFGNSLADDYVQQVILRHMTIEDAIVNEEKQQEIDTLQKQLVELLQRYVAILIQRLSQKRLSLREANKTT